MKIVISVLAFLFTLTLAHVTLAEEHHDEQGKSKSEAEEEQTVEHMRALFPPKTPNVLLAEAPPKTELQEPAYFANLSGSDKVTLRWKAIEGADSYHVQVATDPNFKWLVADEHFIKQNTFELVKVEGNHHYFWRVNVVKENNEPTHRKSGFVTSMFETK